MTTNYSPDAMSSVGTLTREERSQAKRVYAENPAILESLILAALGTCEHGEQTAAEMLQAIREGRCDS